MSAAAVFMAYGRSFDENIDYAIMHLSVNLLEIMIANSVVNANISVVSVRRNWMGRAFFLFARFLRCRVRARWLRMTLKKGCWKVRKSDQVVYTRLNVKIA
jgi:hypothetical protein